MVHGIYAEATVHPGAWGVHGGSLCYGVHTAGHAHASTDHAPRRAMHAHGLETRTCGVAATAQG